MGVIKPLWVSKRWFTQCPFNYCDHFGDKLKLATICKICKDELVRDEHYKRAEQDPNDWGNVFKDIADNLAYTMTLIQKQAKEMGIDLDNLPDPEEPPPAENYPIYHLIQKYGKRVEKIINGFKEVPIDIDLKLLGVAIDVFAHSRYYIIAKTVRALHSRFEEEKDPEDDLYDSKTSALFAYMAIERNSRAALALANHKPLKAQKKKMLEFAKRSLEVCEILQKEFFPNDKLVYEEFGCDYFRETQQVQKIN